MIIIYDLILNRILLSITNEKKQEISKNPRSMNTVKSLKLPLQALQIELISSFVLAAGPIMPTGQQQSRHR